jgi:signal transduction histidine kinase/CheY-like chemotaxis protein
MIRHPNNQVYRTVVLLWITLSLVSGLLSCITWYQLREALRTSREAVAIKDAVDGVLKSMLDAETSQRGFCLTGDDTFLDPFDRAKKSVPDQFEDLAVLARQDTNLLARVLDLRARGELFMDYQNKVIAARRDKGMGAAVEIVSLGQGKSLMDEIRRKVADMASAQAPFTSVEARTSRGQLLRAGLTSIIAGTIGLGLGFFAFYLARVSVRHQIREGELIEAKLQAESESQEKSAFLANMSHEIRTPMNAILGFSELLSGELQDSKQRHYLKSIQVSAASLLQLINDILDMSKMEVGLIELRPEPTDPREVCDFLTTVFSEAAAKRGVKLECILAEDLPRALLLDRVRLRQILVNLVGNAVKFTDRGQITTRISWEKQKDSTSCITLIIEVQDTGVGIPKEKLDVIFKPFVQAGAHQDKEKGGTGLGLAIVQRLVQIMDGTVTAASVLGQGSAFHLRFPNVPISVRLPATKLEDTGSATDFNQLKPSRILVVDDNAMNCRLVSSMFEGSHHQLEFGADGRQAVSKAQRFKPDVILMDIRMPNMGGAEAFDEIRKLEGLELLPVIAVTASSLATDEEKLREKFNAFVRKPFTRREMFNVLAQFLATSDQNGDPALQRVTKPADTTEPAPIRLKALAMALRKLEIQEWPGVRDSMAISAAGAFARKLENLAREASYEPLLTYAETLAHFADTYAVDMLEKRLQEFPEMIETIERSGL